MKNRLIPFISLLLSFPAFAFDNDLSINRPNFNTENFLDINNVQFNETLNELWAQSDNGWRIAAHSMSTDQLYSYAELRLLNPISDSVNVKFNFQQEVFYAEKELADPMLEIEIKPFAKYDITASLLGTVRYEKSQSELGFAVTAGNPKSNFIRYSDVTVDYYYNSKTDTNSSYQKFQLIRTLEVAYHWSASLNAKFKFRQFSPMDLIYNDLITHFQHEGYEYDGFIKHKLSHKYHYKISLKGFNIDKSITGTVNQSQQLRYDSIDLKLLTHQDQPYQFTYGVRYDEFSNNIINTTDSSSILDYPFSTRQLYTSMYHAYTEQKAWDIGLYLGLTKEPNEFNQPTVDNSHVYESKLRTSWVYHAANKKSSIFLHISWDLDGTILDPGDGGGITYQSTF